MKKFEAALDIVIKQFGKKIITEKRFVSVLADYNAFYDTPAIRDVIVMCIHGGFMQDLYMVYSRKSIFGGNEKKYKDVRECVTRYKGSINSGRNKKLSDEVIDLIVSQIFEGYNSCLIETTQRNNTQTRNKPRFHFGKRSVWRVILSMFCAFLAYYCYWLNQVIQHNTEIENELQTKEVSLSFKGITLGKNIEKEYSSIGYGWERDLFVKDGIRCEEDWYDYEETKLFDCVYFTFETYINNKSIRGKVRAYKGRIYEIELDREFVKDIENDYIKKYGDPSIDKILLALSLFNVSPNELNWRFKNETITITRSTIRYYIPETMKLVEIYKKEKEEETRQKVLQREREDSIREALKAKEREKREREEKIKQLNDI